MGDGEKENLGVAMPESKGLFEEQNSRDACARCDLWLCRLDVSNGKSCREAAIIRRGHPLQNSELGGIAREMEGGTGLAGLQVAWYDSSAGRSRWQADFHTVQQQRTSTRVPHARPESMGDPRQAAAKRVTQA